MTIEELTAILKYKNTPSSEEIKITITYPDGTCESVPVTMFSTYSDVFELKCESSKK